MFDWQERIKLLLLFLFKTHNSIQLIVNKLKYAKGKLLFKKNNINSTSI